jgi:hypothetical protein
MSLPAPFQAAEEKLKEEEEKKATEAKVSRISVWL